MKELTLMNRYHQTQERPNPPVEQRVKVMDTLDKKMQTILEREVGTLTQTVDETAIGFGDEVFTNTRFRLL
jgi:hypothetical protein